MEHHEIVIVGAGPAGLTAAKILGEGGKDVLVLEKLPKDRIGDKVCAGGIFRHGLIYIPKFLLEKSCDSLTFHVNGWATTINTVDGEPFLYTVDRLKLGQYQIGSDGSTSVIARGLGFYNDKAVCVEWYVEGRDEFEVIIDDALGMGWVTYSLTQDTQSSAPARCHDLCGLDNLEKYLKVGAVNTRSYWVER
jgi:Dehydrogenases (flavoproteins)